MLTKADDYLIHQTSEPIAHTATSDRNFYDRYFFNGYARDGSLYFAAALGLYPNRQIMDAAFNVVLDGVQYVLRASRRAPLERMETEVGPIRVEVIQPMRHLKLSVDPNDQGISADLEFHARANVLEEPRFFRRTDARVWMDYTRLTQHGEWSGTLTIDGRTFRMEPGQYWGSRDRSWGVRPVGEREAGIPSMPMQFFWLWAPMNFENLCTHFDVNEEADGTRWHTAGMWVKQPSVLNPGEAESTVAVDYHLEMQSGTRHARAASLTLGTDQADPLRIELTPLYNFYMNGLGYGHPTWGHGMFVGESAVVSERWKLSDLDPTAPMHLHIQAICSARCGEKHGIGILEQLILGPHAPTGLRGLFDPAT